MRVLELFAGSRSFSETAKQYFECVTFTIDIEPFDGIDFVADIEFIGQKDIPFLPDIIWASPPCTSYSIAAVSHHRMGIEPKSSFAEKSDRLLGNTIKIIKDYIKINPRLVFFIENPVGMMRKMPEMMKFDRATVTYCSYGDTRMKPTDIWTNYLYTVYNPSGWQPLPMCFNNNPHCLHERAPRGSKTGTQGLNNDYERSRIPISLCMDILKSCIR